MRPEKIRDVRFSPPLAVLTAAVLTAAALLLGAALPAPASAARPLSPQQIRAAYSLPARGASGQTIAVLSAYDDPHIESDLDAYSKHFGLSACTTADGCFRKLNEQGRGTPLPPVDPTGSQWLIESALGVETAHGICESCKIMLVEANSPNPYDLGIGAAAAAKAGATVVVTAVTPIESPEDESTWGSDFTHPGTAFLAAVGDPPNGQWGFGGEIRFPSSLPNVIAVGGTQLTLSRGGGYGSEQAWDGTVSGCSNYNRAPSWQAKDAAGAGCGTDRAVADISAMADPGALIHIAGTNLSGGPWFEVSGTSLAAPIIAGAIGLAGSVGEREAQMLYERAASDPGAFHDIVKGSNTPAGTCGTLSICQAERGWDGPTGLGTPHGLAAFLANGGALSSRRPQLSASAPHDSLHANRRWVIRVGVGNSNPFAVSGSLVVGRTLRVGNRLRTIRFATARFNVGPLAGASPKLTITRSARGLLARMRSVLVYVQLHARGPAGRPVTVTKALRLYAR